MRLFLIIVLLSFISCGTNKNDVSSVEVNEKLVFHECHDGNDCDSIDTCYTVYYNYGEYLATKEVEIGFECRKACEGYDLPISEPNTVYEYKMIDNKCVKTIFSN